jgi:hypothetical protein
MTSHTFGNLVMKVCGDIDGLITTLGQQEEVHLGSPGAWRKVNRIWTTVPHNVSRFKLEMSDQGKLTFVRLQIRKNEPLNRTMTVQQLLTKVFPDHGSIFQSRVSRSTFKTGRESI